MNIKVRYFSLNREDSDFGFLEYKGGLDGLPTRDRILPLTASRDQLLVPPKVILEADNFLFARGR